MGEKPLSRIGKMPFMLAKRYTVSDGQMVLTLEPDEDWFVVTSPTDPAMITQARTVQEAFEMVRDAFAALAASRAVQNRWDKPQKRSRKSA